MEQQDRSSAKIEKYTFTLDTLKYLLTNIKNKFVTKEEMNNKVDKVEGKELSANNFSDEDINNINNSFDDVELNEGVLFLNQETELYTRYEIPDLSNLDDIIYLTYTVNGIEKTITLDNCISESSNYYLLPNGYDILFENKNGVWYYYHMSIGEGNLGITYKTASELTTLEFYSENNKIKTIDLDI